VAQGLRVILSYFDKSWLTRLKIIAGFGSQFKTREGNLEERGHNYVDDFPIKQFSTGSISSLTSLSDSFSF
jgi:hypothetical protein